MVRISSTAVIKLFVISLLCTVFSLFTPVFPIEAEEGSQQRTRERAQEKDSNVVDLTWLVPELSGDAVKWATYFKARLLSGNNNPFTGDITITGSVGQPFLVCAQQVITNDFVQLSAVAGSDYLHSLWLEKNTGELSILNGKSCPDDLVGEYPYHMANRVRSTEPFLVINKENLRSPQRKVYRKDDLRFPVIPTAPFTPEQGLLITSSGTDSGFDDQNDFKRPPFMPMPDKAMANLILLPTLNLPANWREYLPFAGLYDWLTDQPEDQGGLTLLVQFDGQPPITLRISQAEYPEMAEHLLNARQLLHWLAPKLNGREAFVQQLMDMADAINETLPLWDVEALDEIQRQLMMVLEQPDTEFSLEFELHQLACTLSEHSFTASPEKAIIQLPVGKQSGQSPSLPGDQNADGASASGQKKTKKKSDQSSGKEGKAGDDNKPPEPPAAHASGGADSNTRTDYFAIVVNGVEFHIKKEQLFPMGREKAKTDNVEAYKPTTPSASFPLIEVEVVAGIQEQYRFSKFDNDAQPLDYLLRYGKLDSLRDYHRGFTSDPLPEDELIQATPSMIAGLANRPLVVDHLFGAHPVREASKLKLGRCLARLSRLYELWNLRRAIQRLLIINHFDSSPERFSKLIESIIEDVHVRGHEADLKMPFDVYSLLHIAVNSGRQELVRGVLELSYYGQLFNKEKVFNINVDALTATSGETLLHLAVNGLIEAGTNKEQTTQSLNIIKLLMEFDGSPDIPRPSDGSTALFLAAKSGDFEAVYALLGVAGTGLESIGKAKAGVDINHKRESDQATILHAAVESGNRILVRLLLYNDADPSAFMSREGKKLYPLDIALENGNAELIKILAPRSLFLFDLCRDGNLEQIRRYINAGIPATLERRGRSSLLHNAASGGNEELIEFLITQGADVNNASDGITPLHSAICSGCLRAVMVLTKHKAERRWDRLCRTPLKLALMNHQNQIAKHLFNHYYPDPETQPLLLNYEYEHDDEFFLALKNAGCLPEKILNWAITSKNPKLVELFLKNGADVKECNEAGETVLTSALINCNDDIVRILLKHGASVNQSDNIDRITLIDAVHAGNISIVKMLLEHQVYDSQQNHIDESIIQVAHMGGHLEIARLLLQSLESSKAYIQGLAYACLRKNEQLVWFLLENRSAAPPYKDVFSARIPQVAEAVRQCGSSSLYQLLLENCSSSDSKETASLSPLDADNIHLFHAARIGNLTKLRKLLKKSNALNTGNALYFAVLKGHFDAAWHLLANGANSSFTRLTEGNTPLHGAIQNHHPALVELLLSYGADLWQTNRHNVTPLDIALQSKHTAMAQVLQKHLVGKLFQAVKEPSEEMLQQVLDSDDSIANRAQECDGASPLWVATQLGHLDIVKQLLKHQANPNLADSRRYAPLHLAAMKGYIEIARMLLDAGAEPNALNEDGYAPLHLAVMNGHHGVTQLLLGTSGIETNAFSINGETPLHLAARGEQIDIIGLLLASGADFQEKDIQGDTALHTLCREFSPQALEQVIQTLEHHLNQKTLRTLNDRQETPLSLLMSRPVSSGAIRQQFMKLANRPPSRARPAPGRNAHQAQGKPEATPFVYAYPEKTLNRPGGFFTIEVAGSAFRVSHHQLEPARHGQEFPGHVMAAMTDNPEFQLALDQLEEVMGIPPSQQLAKNHESPLNYLTTYGTADTKQQLPGYYRSRVVSPRQNHLLVERKPAVLTAEDICVVCQYPLLTRDVLVRPPCDCKQCFHGYCLATLLKTATNPQCPVCTKHLPELAGMLGHSLLAEQELHSAARSGNRYVLKTMLEAGANADAADGDGNTALHMAAQGGHPEIALLLAKHGVAPDLPNKAGHTAKTVAKQAGHLEVADIISQASATPSIFFTVGHGHREALITYLGEGEDVAITRTLDNYSLLHLAAENGQTEMVRLLLNASDQLNQGIEEMLDCHQRSPLFVAAENGHADILDILLNRNTSMLDRADSSGNTPLIAAARKGQVDAVFRLVEEGASLASLNKMATTPLHAILQNFPEYGLATFLEKQAHTLTPSLLTDLSAQSQSPLGLLTSRGDISAGIKQVFLGLAPDYVAKYPAAAQHSAQAFPAATTGSNDCSICFDGQQNTVLMPCRHMVCGTCAERLKTCPFCNKKIESRLSVYPQ